ncbi:MAG: hypothetical protein JST87_01295 [Bacteroidetes bacterium]|nr:hypothetical protein [Bacteroidota bacterium]MBS1932888.1 hypothetical protein [Bacteroidota bacterium]
MKPNTSAHPQIDYLPSLLPANKKKHPISPKAKKHKQVAPPDEEYCTRLNAMAQQYPFCIYYHEKNNDPL